MFLEEIVTRGYHNSKVFKDTCPLSFGPRIILGQVDSCCDYDITNVLADVFYQSLL